MVWFSRSRFKYEKINTMKNKLTKILDKLSKQELEDFIKQDFSNSDIDLQKGDILLVMKK